MARGNSSQIIIGILLVCLGFLFLLHTLGLVPRINWLFLLDFWPLILIFIGLNILLKDTGLWWLVPLLLVATIIFLLVFTNFFYYRNYHYEYDFDYDHDYHYEYNPGIFRDSGTYRSSIEMDEKIKRLKVDLSFGAGRIYLGATRDEEKLYEAILRYRYRRPRVDYLFEEEKGEGHLVVERVKDFKWFNLSGEDNWRLYLTERVPVDLEINTGAGKFNLNLEKLQVKELTVNAGAGDLEIDLGDYTSQVELNLGAASVDLNLPRETGIEIRTTGVISKNNFIEAGLKKVADNTYQSENYQQAANKIEIEIAASASNIDLRLY